MGFFLLPIDGFRHNNLSRIVFPENAQEIHSDAFGDNALTELVFEGGPTIYIDMHLTLVQRIWRM